MGSARGSTATRAREGSEVKSSGYWITAVIGLIVLVVGMLILSGHHTPGLVAIIVGVLMAVVGIVMALRSGGAEAARRDDAATKQKIGDAADKVKDAVNPKD